MLRYGHIGRARKRLAMNNKIIHFAKSNVKTIHTNTQNLTPGNVLIVYPNIFGFDIGQCWPEWANEMPEKICFGSHPLKLNQVKEIIKDTEYLNFI
jgi:hypothetical protein